MPPLEQINGNLPGQKESKSAQMSLNPLLQQSWILRAWREAESVKKTCAERVSQRKSLEANCSLVNARAFTLSVGKPFHAVIYM
jgi:hypothetical protein